MKTSTKRELLTLETICPGPMMVSKSWNEEDRKFMAEWVAKDKAKRKAEEEAKSLTKQ